MNVLLVYPRFPDTFWSLRYALRFIRRSASHPPLGLLTIGALLPGDFDQRLVDMNVEALTDGDLGWADMVFISAMVVQRESVKSVIARCREKGVTVVAGGPLFTGEPDEFRDVDHLVLDEAEITLPLFMEDLKAGRPKRVYRSEGFCDIEQSPTPAWGLLKMKKYASMSLQFSRGCPFNCDFCNVTVLFGHKPRMKRPEQITAELDSLYALGWRGNVFFVDDNFIGNKQYLKSRLLPALIAWRKGKKGFVFYTEASINLADDPELMRLMVRAGFDSVFIGIESPDEACLAECRKKQNTNRDLLQSVKTIQRAGLQVTGGFIVGFDNDTRSIFQRQIDFIQKSGIVTAMVGILNAPPGTRLFARLQGENRLISKITGDNVDGTTNIIPKMGIDSLLEGYRTLMGHIYSPKHYYRRVKVFLKEFGVPRAKAPLTFQSFLAFFRSCFLLGVWGKERFQYWKLLFWTLLRKPRVVSLAVTLAVYGYHYRRICEMYILPKRKALPAGKV